MNKNSLLTIAIPTFNRINNLKYIVDKVIPYLNSELSLLIIDNNSNDATSDYCQEIIKSSLYIRYIKNNVNLGGTVNMLRCIEFSNAEFTWLLGDDDDIDVLYFKELLNELKKYDSQSYHLLPSSRKYYYIEIDSFSNLDDFVNYFYDITALNLMSSNIYNTNHAKKYLIDAYRLVHLQHAFSTIHVKILENQGCIKIIKLPILKDEQITNKRWSKFSAHIDAIDTSYQLFGKRIIKKEYQKRKRTLLKIALLSIFSSKDEGYNEKEIKRLFELLGISKFVLPLFLYCLLKFSKIKPTQYMIVYCVYIIFYYKYGRDYKKEIRNTFNLDEESYITNELLKKISINKKDNYFKN